MRSAVLPALLLALFNACAPPPSPPSAPGPAADRLWAELWGACGRAFAGSAAGGEGDPLLPRGELVLHVARCTPAEIRLAVLNGPDRSRGWVLSRSPGGLRLMHLHRGPDGREARASRYGGVGQPGEWAGGVDFPADSLTSALLPHAAADVWTLTVEPEGGLSYRRRRGTTEPDFHAGFNLRHAVPLPPLPGSECSAAGGTRGDPLPGELRCRWGITGPGRFGLFAHSDVAVYQPATPLPGSHVVGVPGLPKPRRGESYEAWEWRVHRTEFGPWERRAERSLEVLDPRMAARILALEGRMREEGIPVRRRETWRSPSRQAWIFQQGRSRPGPIATATLTSWHSQTDAAGRPAGRAVDYDVSWRNLPRFHELAAQVGLESFGADSYDAGHVFLPAERGLSAEEVAVLRLLPRLPVVTLATGRPENEGSDPIALRLFRASALRWAAERFAPVPELRPVHGRVPQARLARP
jgi:hypothetical protein